MRLWGEEGSDYDEDEAHLHELDEAQGHENPTDIMPPDDPRHGSRPGVWMHRHLGIPLCDACLRWMRNG